jgi:hypothetical protein
MPPKPISYKKLLRDVQTLEKKLTRALEGATPGVKQRIALDLKAFGEIEKSVRARCFGGVLFAGVRQLPAKRRGRGPARKRSSK